MAFYGCEFIFDGLPSTTYGLTIYDFGGISEDGSYSQPDIIEDRTVLRSTPLHYGVVRNSPLVFNLTFGVSNERIDTNNWLDRWEMDAIAQWLTGHDDYKYLDIIQPDMDAMRYKCIITDLRYITYGKYPWGFECTVTCDSPYGYLRPDIYNANIDNSGFISIRGRAATKYYYPKVQIEIPSGAFSGISSSSESSITISNIYDESSVFKLSGLGHYTDTIIIDNENEIITSARGENMYAKFNGNFLRLNRGENKLFVECENCKKCTVTITCEFPVNIGG